MNTFFRELLHVGLYKRTQGRVTRQVTFAAVAVTLALGLWRMSSIMAGEDYWLQFGVPAALLAAGLWASFRLVNVPAVADFLIAVEAEMNKVSWPSWSELVRGSGVVLAMMFAFAFVLAGCDIFWKLLLSWGLGIL